MVEYSKSDIANFDRICRLTLVNSITGYKPANLIGTSNQQGQTNLAIISSVVHLGSDPALLAFVMRPLQVERHTLENILETGYYTINHIHQAIAKRAHYTSADFPREVSEFERCNLTPQYLNGFGAPFVSESRIKIGLSLADTVKIQLNETIMVIGHVEHIFMEEDYFDPNKGLDLNRAGSICISGLDSYHEVKLFDNYPYATPDNTPPF